MKGYVAVSNFPTYGAHMLAYVLGRSREALSRALLQFDKSSGTLSTILVAVTNLESWH